MSLPGRVIGVCQSFWSTWYTYCGIEGVELCSVALKVGCVLGGVNVSNGCSSASSVSVGRFVNLKHSSKFLITNIYHSAALRVSFVTQSPCLSPGGYFGH